MHLLKRAMTLIAGTSAILMTLGITSAYAKTAQHNPHLAGYIAVQKSGGSVSEWHAVQATFTVPAVNCSVTPNSTVYHYVVLGPRQKGSQAAGIVEGCSGGSPFYYGSYWYSEYYYGTIYGPYGPNDVLSINPGDTVRASVNSNIGTGTDTFLIADKTTGTYHETDYTGVGQQANLYYRSAGVLSYGNISSQGTADFSSVSFSKAEVAQNAAGGGPKPLSNPTRWKLIEDEQIGPVTDTPDIVPGPISSTSSGSSFTDNWKAAN
jgi:Peptidase A4 family